MKLDTKISRGVIVPMPLEVCNLDKPFRRYHVCTEDWLTAGRTHSGRTGRELASLGLLQDGSDRTTTPSDPGGNGPRSTEIITSRPTRPCDLGSKGPRSTRSPRTRSPLMQF
ncbi:unnamed protein product [Microthlaspi erraticum]|uniref:Uncharacterized protein n=1 Tax=Microthlaspi erraticum TaxID=1685480 RepID=A0A6D2IHX9_9BRAS|nr:unnamed protein product [Microthlaspi erraticum]